MNCIYCLVHKDNKETKCTNKRHKFCQRYKVIYTSGGGTEYEDGIWIVERTQKTTTAIKILHHMTGIYSMHDEGFKTRIGLGTGNPIKNENEDGSFIVYFRQAGTPYYFEPMYE